MEKEPVEIIENNKESIDEFHQRGWGACDYYVTEKHIEALRGNKALAICDGEYTHVITLHSKERGS